jgi:predicted alpha/beta-fold hydrolase
MASPSRDFRPFPLLGNPHIQTILGLYARNDRRNFPAIERVVTLPDGDRLLLADSTPPDWPATGSVAVLVHGQSGSAESGPVHWLAGQLFDRAWRAVRINLRGNWPGLALARGGYHGGSSADVRAVVDDILRDAPNARIALVGFSLGANIVLKLAGEAGLDGSLPQLERVAAVAPPVDLAECTSLMGQPQNRLYERYFVRELYRRVRARRRIFPDLPPLEMPYLPSARLWDELYTAPRNGFANAFDYYERCSSAPLVPEIKVPTMILAARDDPFVPAGPIERLEVPEHIQVWMVNSGGHLGFIGPDGEGGVRWAERRVLDWLVDS